MWRALRTAALCGSAVLSLVLCQSVALARACQHRLVPNASVLQTCAGTEEAAYLLDVPAGSVLELSVAERQGMAGLLVVSAEDGREAAYADLARRHPSARSVLVPAGSFRVLLRPVNHSAVERIFELRAGELRPDEPAMRLRLRAEQLLGEGERAYRQKAPDYLKTAAAAYEASLESWMQSGDTGRQADLLSHLAYVRYEQGEMKAALDLYERALELWSTLQDRPGIATALQGKALIAVDTGQQKDAEEWGTRALDIRRALSDLRGQVETLFVLGTIPFVKGESDLARARYDEALAMARQAGDRVREADAMNFTGVLEFQLGRWEEAARLYAGALSIDREESEPVRAAQRLNNLGSLHTAAGEIRESIAYLTEALPIRKTLASPNAYGNTLYNLALNHAELGEYQTALAGYTEALALFRRVGYPRGEGFVLRALGDLYLATGEDARAEQFLRQASDRWKSISDRRGEVLALNSLGSLAGRRRDYATASRLHSQALEIARAAGLQREELQTYGHLARVARDHGNFQLAVETAGRQLDLARKLGDKVGEAGALQEQGVAWRRLGEIDRARGALEQSVALSTSAGTRMALAVSLEELARADRAGQRLAEADDHVSQALRLIEAIGTTAGNRESRMRFAAAHRRSFDLAIGLAMERGQTGRAFELSERARARSLVDMMREAGMDIRAGVDPDLLARERRIQELLNAKHDRFTRMLGSPHSAARETAERGEIDRLVDEYQAVEAELRVKSPAYAALMAPKPLSVGDVQSRLLDRGTALIEFWIGEDRSYAWLVSETECRGFVLPPRGQLGPLATRAYRALNARNRGPAESPEQRAIRVNEADTEFTRLSAELSRTLLRPLRGLTARRLWIVSDGELEYVPLAALPLPDSAGPVVSRYEVIGLPSASVLAVVREQLIDRPPAARTVAVFADPVFRPDDPRVIGFKGQLPRDVSRAAAEAGVSTLPRLYFSRDEAETIVSLAPDGRSRKALDFDASRSEATKADIGRYRVVHFATHGLVNSTHPELSGIVLSLVDPRGRPQDGFLRLHEIYNLKLSAELVVLSACQTALGQDVRSEGLVGLVRGFMYAGSPQVVASLWSVRDRATAEFMQRFYAALFTQRLTPAAALRAAQLSLFKDARWNQPYYWAAFTLQGGPARASH